MPDWPLRSPATQIRGGRRRQPKKIPYVINEALSIDFVADWLFDASKLIVVDLFTRECLAIGDRPSISG